MSGDNAGRKTRNPEKYREVFEQFEAAWAKSAEGAQEPRIDDFLGPVSEEDLTTVRYSLETLAGRLRDAHPTTGSTSFQRSEQDTPLTGDSTVYELPIATGSHHNHREVDGVGQATIAPLPHYTNSGNVYMTDNDPDATVIFNPEDPPSELQSPGSQVD